MWQRTEEGLLAVRYYYWCLQCAAFVVLPMIYRKYDFRSMVWTAVYGLHPAYEYQERHGWGCEHTDRSATDLVHMMRRERAQIERAWLNRSLAQSPMADGYQYVTPLVDRMPPRWEDYAPKVKAVVIPEPWIKIEAGDTDVYYIEDIQTGHRVPVIDAQPVREIAA